MVSTFEQISSQPDTDVVDIAVIYVFVVRQVFLMSLPLLLLTSLLLQLFP